MKKNYEVEVKLIYKVFYEDDGWIDDYEYSDMIINDIERDDIEEYIKTHKPRPKYVDVSSQYMVTGIELIRVYDDDEAEEDEVTDEEA